MRHPNLVQRDGIYYFRRRVPTDLLSSWDEGPVVMRSLRTRDYREAVSRLRLVQGETERKFDQKRTDAARLRELERRTLEAGVFSLTVSELDEAVSKWHEERWNELQARERLSATRDEIHEVVSGLEEEHARLTSPVFDDYRDLVAQDTHRLLIRAGMPITRRLGPITLYAKDAGSPLHTIDPATHRLAFAKIRAAQIALNEAQTAQLRGWPVPSPRAPTPTARGSYRLGHLISDFATDPGRGNRTAKTDLDYGMVFRAMKDVIGENKAVAEISQDDCMQVRDLLLALPRDATKRYPGKRLTDVKRGPSESGLKTSTINSHLGKMNTIFVWAVDHRDLPKSPAAKLLIRRSVEEEEEDGRRSFTPDELRTMFHAPLYTGCKDDGRNFWKPGPNHPRGSRFWVPLIALFSGLRQTEICQLAPADIEPMDGVAVVHVRKTADWQKLKSKSARRYVPLHPELLRIGLPEYAARVRGEGHPQLFPDVKPDARGYMGAVFQKRFNSFRHRVGVSDPDGVFHSFRHTWRDAVREARISEEMAQVLGGWAGRGQDKRYGTQRFSAGLRFEDIARIQYPGLDLSHLYSG